jgi:hypothetical protein
VKGEKKLIAIGVICFFGFCGCAGFGVWSTSAQTDITKFQAWADQWINGALAAAPTIIAAASAIPGVPASDIAAATNALAAASGAMTVVDTIGTEASANTIAAATGAVVSAINQVSSTVGQVQATIAAAK